MNSAIDGAVLQLPPGTCATNVTVANTASFTLEGAAGGVTILEPVIASSPIIQSTANVRFTLSGLTFTGASGAPAILLQGAAEAITISRDAFRANSYQGGVGGAISIQAPAPTATTEPTETTGRTEITGSRFSGNRAASGGAIAVLSLSVPLLISGSTFTGNAAANAGGALFIFNAAPGSSSVRIAGNRFGRPGLAANSARAVGGGAAIELAHGHALELSANAFEGDAISGSQTATAADERRGGGLFLGVVPGDTAFAVDQWRNTFVNNEIDETEAQPPMASPLPAGGAGEWIQGLTVRSTADEFIGNRVAADDGRPPEGGALGVLSSAAAGAVPAQRGALVASDDLFTVNSTAAGGRGGAIYVGDSPASCTGPCPTSAVALTDSTVVDNVVSAGRGSQGGAIWGSPGDDLHLYNSIVFGDLPRPALVGFGAPAAATIEFSDVCRERRGTPVPAGAAAGNICASPALAPTGVETRRSPTIDAGSNALVPVGLTTDLGGRRRIRASLIVCGRRDRPTVDMGAYEFSATGPVKRALQPRRRARQCGP
jgi:predicted outer membrane repeat protein